MSRAMCLFGLAACGRVGFGAQPASIDAPLADADIDAELGACGRMATAPDPVHVRGRVFRYRSFDNTRREPIANATITTMVPGGAPTTTSDVTGAYDLAIPTGGVAIPLRVRYTLGTDWVTEVVFDQPVDRDVSGPYTLVLQPGDGPIWNDTGMNAVFAATMTTPDPVRGVINLSVRDCAGLPIGGAVIDVQPPPEVLAVQADDGSTLISDQTQATYGQAFAINAVAGMTTITITHPARTFAPFSVMVNGGAVNTLVVARATD